MLMLRYFKIITVVIAVIWPLQLVSQEKNYTAKEALSIFKAGNYSEAEKAYASLLKRYDLEVRYNYYYGICLLQNNKDIKQAVTRLKYAAVKGVSRDAFYYLGRAYQLSYRFDDALAQYNRFLKYAAASDIRNEKAEKYKRECEMGRRLSAKVYNFEVYRRDTVSLDNILQAYHPAKDVGRITHNSDFFEAGVNPNDILYLTERGNEVYFTMDSETDGDNLYKMEKLLDGWSERKPLSEINSGANESHPFVVIDGSTIFFSSDREGGLGGYDLYKAIYDAETKTFSNPVNLGIPFNSPKDDYLFVADEFNEMAWFSSNRETNDSTLVVYNIRWDNTVVKNLVEDMNDVQQVASLTLSGEEKRVDEGKAHYVFKPKKEALFHFVVADTMEYTQLEHFKSENARSVFEQGLSLVRKKDSLSNQMSGKREMYARTNSDETRSILVDHILMLEKQVYGLDEKIERSFFQAKLIEQEEVRRLVREGRYDEPAEVKIEKEAEENYNNILIPGNYTFYTEQGFAKELEELEDMYQALFNSNDIRKLRHADSLYVWGNILTLESSKLLEAANSQQAESKSLMDLAFRSKDSLEEEESMVASQVQQAKELKISALKLYHESLNRKFKIYGARLKELKITNTTQDLSYLDDQQDRAKEYFRKAFELIDPINGFDSERYERSGALKRTGVQIQEDGLFKFVELQGGDPVLPYRAQPKSGEPKAKVPKTYQELQGFSKPKEVVKKEPQEVSKVVENAFKKPEPKQDELVYKIQIGVFRNDPNAQALSQIPPISKIVLPERGLTKFFSGSYKTYAEAQNNLVKVQQAGFAGAFIVVFKAGKQIKLTEDLKR